MSEAEQDSASDKPNLVLLLRGLWDVDNPSALQDIVWRTFRKKLVYCEDPKADSKGTDILGIALPNVFIQFDGFFFHILAVPSPFFENREAIAGQLGELRMRQAVLDHEAFISVNLLNYPEETDVNDAARMIGRMTAALGWSPATLGVVSPMLQQIRVWDRNVRKALRTQHPVTAFIETPPCRVPIVPGDPDDADLKAATEEARRRWPEFAAAFARQTAEQTFAVKAPFTEGEFTEFMWIKVLKIEDDYLQGVIDNDPMNVKKYKRGTRVRLRIKAITDWLYTENDKLVGEFTNKALDKAAKARLAQIRVEREQAEEDLDDEEEEEEPQPHSRRASPPAASKPAVQPKSSSSGVMGIALAAGAALLLLCGGGGIGLAIWLFRPKASEPVPNQPIQQQPVVPNQPVQQPPAVPRLRPHGGNSGEHIAREFAEALSRKDLHAAYTCTTLAFQQRQSEEQFRNAVLTSRVLEGRLPFEMDAFAPRTPREDHFNLRNKGAGSRHPPAAVLDLLNDDKGWWVDNAAWKGPAPVEVVGAKPPEPKRLRERGGNSDQHIISDFARALSNKDVPAAYACTTPDFQKAHSLEEFTRAVNDSKILDGKMPLQPEFERILPNQERRWHLRHFRVPASVPHAVILQAKADSLGWWVTQVEWKGK